MKSRGATGHLAHLLDSVLANPVGRSGAAGAKGKEADGEPYTIIRGL